MACKYKRKETDKLISESEEGPAKKTFKKTDDVTVDDGDIIACELSMNRRVVVRSWQGKPVVDIREFYLKDGKQMPGKKGISLSMDQWTILCDHVDEIDTAVAENN